MIETRQEYAGGGRYYDTKEILILLAIVLAVMMMQGEACASPDPQYCSSDEEYDYYVVDVFRPHNPAVRYVTVRRSDDTEYIYMFSYNLPPKPYFYTYFYPKSRRNILSEGYVDENWLANDILYVALHWLHDD